MVQTTSLSKRYGLEHHGIRNPGRVYWDLPTPALYEHAIRRGEAHLAHLGPLVVRSQGSDPAGGRWTYVVAAPDAQESVWWSERLRPFEPAKFELLYQRLLAYLQGKDLFVRDCWAGAHHQHRIAMRVITETAWHNLFAHNIFIQPDRQLLPDHRPELTLIHTPRFQAMPEVDGTEGEAFVLVHLGKKLVLIGGTGFAGRIKDAVFTFLTYLFPQERVLAMRCAANYGGDKDDVALFFGLPGTGKTTLSTTPDRKLLGDDAHGWCDQGVFNFEGGCYAKLMFIQAAHEPQIYQTTRMFGTILENVVMDPDSRRLDFEDTSLAEDSRAAYPIAHIPYSDRTGQAGHPRHIIMLACDAFGVMPPLARLSVEQAVYYFLSGYSGQMRRTQDRQLQPAATFSPCFGASCIALPPTTYGKLLREKIQHHQVECWLVNTGWTGGPYGLGKRIALPHTRAMIRAILTGALRDAQFAPDPVFGLQVPTACPDVPTQILQPRATWADPAAYDHHARKLAVAFWKNFSAIDGPTELLSAGPMPTSSTTDAPAASTEP